VTNGAAADDVLLLCPYLSFISSIWTPAFQPQADCMFSAQTRSADVAGENRFTLFRTML
jgi:hypothetical protein